MKLAIYAHWNESDRVIWFAWRFLDSLREIGFEIVFVSNSPICDEDMQRLQCCVQKTIVRENRGLDFFMWKAALAETNLAEVSELLLTNSSIIGPVFSLGAIFEKTRGWDCDVWAMTDSCEIDYHLQSYFLVFRKNVLESKELLQFWQNLIPFQSKTQMIRSYEVGLTAWLLQLGFKCDALAKTKDVWKRHLEVRRRLPFGERMVSRWLDPQSLSRKLVGILRGQVFLGECTPISYPDLLLELGVPFVKASLLASESRSAATKKAIAVLIHHGFVSHENIHRSGDLQRGQICP